MTANPFTCGPRTLLTLPLAPRVTRYAFALNAPSITAALPKGSIGAYLLLTAGGSPIYVGRSDTCLRQRLLRHPLRRKATHFTATVVSAPHEAYMLECYWWHRYRRDGTPHINLSHPAGQPQISHCPFCAGRGELPAAAA